MRVPKCPKCGREMQKIQARDHWFWRCFNVSKWHHELFGILGQTSNFRTKRLIDPVTLEIVNNPHFNNVQSLQ